MPDVIKYFSVTLTAPVALPAFPLATFFDHTEPCPVLLLDRKAFERVKET